MWTKRVYWVRRMSTKTCWFIYQQLMPQLQTSAPSMRSCASPKTSKKAFSGRNRGCIGPSIICQGMWSCWKNRELYGNTILHLATFHTTCNLLFILGKCIQVAGLGDICIESGIPAERSVSCAVEGKIYLHLWSPNVTHMEAVHAMANCQPCR